MLKAASLVQHLSALNHRLSPVQVTLQNYVAGLFHESEEIRGAEVQQLLYDAMDYTHWQQESEALGVEVPQLLLEADRALNGDAVGAASELEGLVLPQELQIIRLQSKQTWLDVLSAYLTFQYQDGSQFRILPDALNKKMVAVVLHPTSEVTVRVFDSRFVIEHGALVPLHRDRQVQFDSRFELKAHVIHKLDLGSYTTTRFSVDEAGRWFGGIVRGYSFQKLPQESSVAWQEVPRVFFAVKRLEQFFLRRESDPYYQQITAQLERLSRLLGLSDRNAVTEAPVAVGRARAALEQIFHNDRLLPLLIDEVERRLAVALGSSRPQGLQENETVELGLGVNRNGRKSMSKAVPSTKAGIATSSMAAGGRGQREEPSQMQREDGREPIRQEQRMGEMGSWTQMNHEHGLLQELTNTAAKENSGSDFEVKKEREIQWQLAHLNFVEETQPVSEKDGAHASLRERIQRSRTRKGEFDLTN